MPVAITLFYVALGVSWIVFSDLAVEALVASPQTPRGSRRTRACCYVLLSAAVIYLLLRLYHGRSRASLEHRFADGRGIEASKKALRQANQELERRVTQRLSS